ncbi:hypothetical protein PTTG_28900 [Puccinia triticina 1-1 BBBD Race 1]|uniref:DNA damage-binding protein CMR1 n=2 Tax=Puccinia triticina TaxID=208348 RepID=A0A180G839_PUCT1|nr:uncharacterized protein PtA15_2A110 [Puccinia triticina]OAV88856.1 hypothetical protein PTTG_28900 [Puccinia triticina 1-1 BBBD Race 1]WAQ81798.1 hypothetical protein PtA15_2A110 [Puccinia triticina]
MEIVDCQALSPADAILFSAFDCANHGRDLWVSDTAGGLVHRDLRQPKSSAPVVGRPLRRRSAASVSVPTLNTDWHSSVLRALLGLLPSSEIGDVEQESCLASHAPGLACSSAYCSPTGDKILSTSYDDLVRVWEVTNRKSRHVIFH